MRLNHLDYSDRGERELRKYLKRVLLVTALLLGGMLAASRLIPGFHLGFNDLADLSFLSLGLLVIGILIAAS